jgi:hypothetical protein
MDLIIAGLAVYKVLQFIDSLLPKEAMPWVKLLASLSLSYGACALISTENILINGAAVAALSGTVHSVLRLLTLSGDAASRKNIR